MVSREYLPIFWSEEELQAGLEGTEVSLEGVASDRRDIEEDYEDHVVGLIEAYGEVFGEMDEAGMGLEAFREAASLVASRAFGVDAEHGDGMVPLADTFNHKVSVVALNEEYGIHGAADSDGSDSDREDWTEDDEKDEDKGDDKDDEKDEEEDGEEEEKLSARKKQRKGDADVPGPAAGDVATLALNTEFPDVMRSTGALELCGMTKVNGMDLRLQIAIIDDEENGCLQIIAASDVRAGDEVWNTYGELSNDVLLKKYGFCVPENPFTFVTLDKASLKEIVEEKLPRKLIDELRSETSLLDEDDEPFLIHANGYVNLALFAFLQMVVNGKVDPEDARIVEAMDSGVPVLLSEALAVEDGGGDVDTKKRHDQCVDALKSACEQRRRGLDVGGGGRQAPDAAVCLRRSELDILERFSKELIQN